MNASVAIQNQIKTVEVSALNNMFYSLCHNIYFVKKAIGD
jgi:hypothetical protein